MPTLRIRGPHLHFAKPCWRCTMARSHHLLRLAFAAIWRSPQSPLVARADRIHRVPEFSCNSRIRGILQHAGSLALLDFPTYFGAELKVITFVVDGPRTVRLKQNSVIGRGNELLQRKRLFARQNADIGHADYRQAVPAFGAQRAARALQTDQRRSFTRA